jgi:GT2 family glycosyltransferase
LEKRYNYLNSVHRKQYGGPDVFEVRDWGSEKAVRFILEPDYELSKYQVILNDQIKNIEISINNLNITNLKVADIIASDRLNVKKIKKNSVNDNVLTSVEECESFDKQELYFTNPYVPSEFKEDNKYLSSVRNKLDMFKRIILHTIKIIALNVLLITSKLLLIPLLKRFLAPLFGLKNNINNELKIAFDEANVVYTDSIGWLLSHLLYLSCDILFFRKLSIKYNPYNYRNVPFTVRSALQKNADPSSKISRLIIHDHLSDDGYTLKAFKGLLNQKDAIIIHCHSLPPEILKWNVTTEVEQGYFLCKEMPEEWRMDYIPSEPVGGWPRISIITVSYNQANFIEDCLNSVLNQGYPNLEYIVVDGNSTDGTIDILNKFKDRINHLIIEPDSGQSNALNKGFKLATGEIMTWICSDDMLIDGALFHIGQAYAENKVDLVVGGCRIISENGELIHHHHTAIPLDKPVLLSFSDMLNFMGSWHKGQYFYQPEVFFSKKIWQLSGGYLKEHLYYAMDYDMFLRMGMAGADILHIPQMIGVSRQHSKQKTQYLTREYLPQIKMIMEEYLEMVNATILTAN